jgi:hypothetical protein
MQAPKRRKVEFDYLPGLAVVLCWLQDHPHCGTSHLILTCKDLCGEILTCEHTEGKVRTCRTDVRLSNLEFFESLGACRYELCKVAADNGDLMFLNRVITTFSITRDLRRGVLKAAYRLDSVKLFLWATTRPHPISPKECINEASKHSALEILSVLANSKNIGGHLPRTLKSFKWFETHFPEYVESLQRNEHRLHFLQFGEVGLLEYQRQLGWEIPYQKLYTSSNDSEVMQWALLHSEHPLSYQFGDITYVHRKLNFEHIFQYHNIDFASYRQLEDKDPTFSTWIKRDVKILDARTYYQLCLTVPIAQLGDIKPEGLLTTHDAYNLHRGSKTYTAEQARAICEHPLFNRGNIQYLFKSALAFGTKELCEYLHSLDPKVEFYWPEDWEIALTEEEYVAKANWLNSVVPLNKRELFDLAVQQMSDNHVIFGWAVERIPKRSYKALMLKLDEEQDSEEWFECLIRLYPKYPHLSPDVPIWGFEIHTKEHFEFMVNWKLKPSDNVDLNWPDDFDFFCKHIEYFGCTKDIGVHLSNRWTEANFQKFLQATPKGRFDKFMHKKL